MASRGMASFESSSAAKLVATSLREEEPKTNGMAPTSE